MDPPESAACPFLVPVVADRLWLYPVAAYCRRPDHPVRVPARATLLAVCATPSHRDCEGYATATAARQEGGRPPGATASDVGEGRPP